MYDIPFVDVLDGIDQLSSVVPRRLDIQRSILSNQIQQLSVTSQLEHVISLSVDIPHANDATYKGSCCH